jgi:hypothetical protein
MCPPDIFRFCSNASDTNIQDVFKDSGLTRTNRSSLGLGHTSYNPKNIGLTGRICPYMLMPVSNITNISNLFASCKRLSGYEIDGNFYLIPEKFFEHTPKLNTLVGTFAYLLIPSSTVLGDVFLPLKKNTLDITQMFYGSV